MPSTLPMDYVVRYDFQGGVNDDLFPTRIAEQQVTSLQNTLHRTAGELSTILGHAQIGNTAVSGSTGRVRGLFQYVTAAGVEYLCGISSEATPHLWTITTGASTFTDQGALTGFTAGNECYAATLGSGGTNYLFITDGAARAFAWDGTSLFRAGTANADMPAGLKGLFVYFGRLWGWKGDKLYYSRPGFPLTAAGGGAFSGGWDQTVGIINVGFGNGESIVECQPYRNDEVSVLMSRSAWRMVNAGGNVFGLTLNGVPAASSFVIMPITTKVGCGAQNSVAQIGKDVYFRDQDGNVRSLRRTELDDPQGAEAIPLSQNIRTTIQTASKTNISKSAAAFFDGQYQLSYPGASQTEVSQTSTFDVNLGSWAGSHTWYATRFLKSSYTGQTKLYFTKPENNFKVYEFQSGNNFDGSAIPISIQTRREDHNKPWQKKVGQFAVFFFQTGDTSTVTIECAKDGGSFQDLTTVALDGNAGTLPQILPFTLGGDGVLAKFASLVDIGPYFDIQFLITHSQLNVQCKFLGYIIASELRDIRQSFVDFGANADGSSG